MSAATNTVATGAPVEEPAPVATHRQPWFVHEVAAILTAALARDDERRRIRCPDCGRSIHDETRS